MNMNENAIPCSDEHGESQGSDDPKQVFECIKRQTAEATEDDLPTIIGALAEASLSHSQEEQLLKLIKDRFKVSLTALRADLKDAVIKNLPGLELPDPDHLDLALVVIDKMGLGDVVFCHGDFFQWQPLVGIWCRMDDREVRKVVQSIIKPATRARVDSVTDICKTELLQTYAPFDRLGWTSINVRNGTLRWMGEEWQLGPHKREDFLTTQLPVMYDPKAECPRFYRFLCEVFAGDDDCNEKIRCVAEAIGYTLLTTCRFEKFFLLIGSGANGKSVLLSILEALVGPSHVAAVQPSKFESTFQRAHLHGKLANIVTEIAEGAEIADAQLKAIVSGELTTAEHKHRDPFDFRPYATCWFGTNHMPHTRDFSDALFRRAIILTFNRKFEGAQCDPHLKGKLLAELPGILNVALWGATEVLKRNGFTIPKSSLAATAEWRRESDHVAQFVEDACNRDLRQYVPSAELYQAYMLWAGAEGIRRIVTHKALTQRLKRLGFEDGRDSTGSVRIIRGLTLKSSY